MRSAASRAVRAAIGSVLTLLAFAAPQCLAAAGGDVRALIEDGRFPAAFELARTRVTELEGSTAPDPTALAEAYELLAEAAVLDGQARDPSTRRAAERALELRIATAGKDDPRTAGALTQLGRLESELGDYPAAERHLRRALELRETGLGPAHPEVADSLMELANLALRRRDNRTGFDLYRRAAEIVGPTLGEDSVEMARCLHGMGAARYAAGFAEDAAGLAERALEMRRRHLRSDHPVLAYCLELLARTDRALGRPEAARDRLLEALAIVEQALGADHPDCAGILNSLGTLAKDLGDYVEARSRMERALALYERSLGPDHPFVAGIYNNLANLLKLVGDLDGAEHHQRHALALRERAFGPDHPMVAQSLTNLGAALRDQRRYAEALALLERAEAISAAAYGEDNLRLVQTLQNLGETLLALGRLDEAENALGRSLAIVETAVGPDHDLLVGSLTELGLVAHERGQLDAARHRLERALRVARASLGEQHPHYGTILFDLARVASDAGEVELAFELALAAEQVTRAHLQLTARALSEREALRATETRRSRLDLLLHLSPRCSGCAERAWDGLVRARGQVLEELAARRRTADDAEAADLIAELRRASERLAALTVRGRGKDPAEAYREQLEAGRHEVERLERELGRASSSKGRQQARADLGFADVAGALPSSTALVAFARTATPVGVQMKTSVYVALVLGPGAAGARSVQLGAADEIDDLVSTWRREAASGADEAAYRRAGGALRARIWDPVAAEIGGACTVLVVPDGALTLVNLAALPHPEGGYLVEREPLLHMLSDERDLVPAPDTDPGRGGGLLVLGDPDFDRAFAASGDERAAATTRASASCAELAQLRFAPLPATAGEAHTIVRLWRDAGPNGSPAPTHLTGAAATEAAFKSLAPGHRVLHLATHGFVLGPGCRPPASSGRGVGGLVPASPDASSDASEWGAAEPGAADPMADPLLLSGLALAGANGRAQADPAAEDGILTAAEITNLDLSGLEWAVLSACDTGLGETSAGEDVFGFRRAFRIAGARTVIMSLWPVDDESGRAFMEALYRARLLDGATTAEAVREASLHVLEARRRAGETAHPYHWGAFVASGDWR